MVIEDPCLACTKQTHLAFTPEGKRFCAYCRTRKEILAAMQRKMWRFSISNRTQMWATQPDVCPKCKLNQWQRTTETFQVPQEYKSIFKGKVDTRTALVCANCGFRVIPNE